jgi:hypothetical protein
MLNEDAAYQCGRQQFWKPIWSSIKVANSLTMVMMPSKAVSKPLSDRHLGSQTEQDHDFKGFYHNK